jgi:predicted phage terminase large subunit-like protein
MTSFAPTSQPSPRADLLARAAAIEAARAELRRRDESLLDFIPRTTPRWSRPVHLAALVSLLGRIARGERVYACISVPPRHGKTETLLHAIAWLLRRSPADTIAYVSYAAQVAESKSDLARAYARAAGVALREDRGSLAEWRTPDGGGVLATGIGGPLTSQGCKVAIVDDPFKNRQDAESALIRQRTWDWFTSTLWTRIEPGGSCIVCHTRWHEDDLIGRLARGEMDGVAWEVINLPAITTDDAGDERALWPERWPVSELAVKRAANEYDWASLFQGQPRARGGEVFRAPARYIDPALSGARTVLAVDPAGTESTRSDWTVAVALAVHGTGLTLTADVVDVLRLRAETGAVAAELARFQTRHGGAPLHIEASRDGKAIARTLRQISPGLMLTEVVPRGDKFVRSQPVATAWNAGRVRVPSSGITAPWVGPFLETVLHFTGISDAHDDDVDALAYAWNAAAVCRDDSDDEIISRAGRRR